MGEMGVGRHGREHRGKAWRREEEERRFDNRWSWHPAMFAADSLSQPTTPSSHWGPGTASTGDLFPAPHSPLPSAGGRRNQTQLPVQWQPANVSTDNVPAAAVQAPHPVAMDTTRRDRHHSSSALPPPTSQWTPTSPSSSSLSSSIQSPPPPIAIGNGHAPPPTTRVSWAPHTEVGGATTTTSALRARRVQSDATPNPPTPSSGLTPMPVAGPRPVQSETSLSNSPMPVSAPGHPASSTNLQLNEPVRQVMPSPLLPLSFSKRGVPRPLSSPQTTPTQPLRNHQKGVANNFNGPTTGNVPPATVAGSATPPTSASASKHSSNETVTIRVGAKPPKETKKPRKLSRKEKAREKKEAKARAKASETAKAHYDLLVSERHPVQPALVRVQSPQAPPGMSQQPASNCDPSHPLQHPSPAITDHPGHPHEALRAHCSQSRGQASNQTQLSPSHPGEG